MGADLDHPLATALYVKTDDLLKAYLELVPARPKIGIMPRISGAELVTSTVMQAASGRTSERLWLRFDRKHLIDMFPDLPRQSGYNKGLRKLADTMSWLVTMLGADQRHHR